MHHPRLRQKSVLILACLFVLTLASSVSAQVSEETADQAPNDGVEIEVESGAAGEAEDRDRFVAVPPATEKAMRYYRSGNLLWWVNLGVSILIPVLFLWTGFSARLRSWATGVGKWWFVALGIYVVAFNIINFVLNLPLAYYQGFVRQHAYDLSNQTLGKWWGDSFKGLMVGLILAVLTTWVPYLLIRKSPKRWWLYTGMVLVPFIFLINMIAPIWIAPLFNDFGPMQDKALESKILALADQAGIEGSRVFEVDKSVDTKAVNAYVTGFLGTKRIVLWDTIVEKLEDEELLFVMGHEMGHYVLGHVVKGTLLVSLLVMAGLYFVHRVSGGLIARNQHKFGFSELGDFASLPLLQLLLGVAIFVFSPGFLAYSRHVEHESDRFSLELTQDNVAAANGFVKLQQENLGNPYPGPLYKFWRASHPPLGERIDFANSYRPWESGQPLRYEDRFAP